MPKILCSLVSGKLSGKSYGDRMKFVSKSFDELGTLELYEILRARVNVFVVEQNCPYPELDCMDKDSIHVYYEEEGKVLAYLRAYPMEPGVVRMGRVLTVERGTGLGGKLLEEGIQEIRERFSPKRIYIEAQTYAVGFYKREGFAVCSEEFLEDGIPHIKMELLF